MNNEKKETIKEYKELLEQGINILNTKLENLKKQDLNESKMGLFQTYTAQLEKYKNNLSKLSNLTVFDDLKEKLDTLSKSKTLKKDKDEIKSYIMNIFSWYEEWEVPIDNNRVIINSDNISTYMTSVEDKIQNLNRLLDVLYDRDEKEIKQELTNKLNDLEVLKRYHIKTSKIEKEIDDLKNAIEIMMFQMLKKN